LAFVDALGLKQIDLLGFSLGGMVAQQMVTRQWLGTSAGAAPMCVSGKRSNERPPSAVPEEAAMAIVEGVSEAPSRRNLMKGGLAAGFLLAFRLPGHAANEPEQALDETGNKFAPNAFIRIDHAGKTTLVMPQVEMGQGVYTSIAMILAEELDAGFANVVLEHAPPSDKLYGNPMLVIQATGNSNSIRAFWKPLRNAGAATRAVLIEAAAQKWNVDPASCTAANGTVTHATSGREITYGGLADSARNIAPPKNAPLKDPKNFTLIGKPLKRLDTPDKINGKAVYGIDVVALVGHDRGARVATRFAKHYPEALDRLVVMDNVPTRIVAFADWSYHPYTISGEAFDTYVKAYWRPGAKRGAMADYRANAEDVAQDQVDADKKIARPTLSLWGADFYAVGQMFDMRAVWAEMAENLKAAEIQQCGHLPQEEQPEIVNKRLMEFPDGWSG
jgi:hypothetical protein